MCIVGLTCFDISTFTSRVYSVEQFISSLRGVSSNDSERHLKFEKVLRYADFPALLDDLSWEVGREKSHNEVFEALAWLGKKGVGRIMSLKVLDRMHNAHDEKRIAVNIRRFGVEKLDWRCLDMAISYLSDVKLHSRIKENAQPIAVQRLTELHLYSSGKRAVVDHWLGENGIRILSKVSFSYDVDEL